MTKPTGLLIACIVLAICCAAASRSIVPLAAQLPLPPPPPPGGRVQPPTKELEAPQILEAMRLVRSYTSLGLSPSFVVEKQRAWEQSVLAADTIVFGPDSQLVFLGGGGDKANVYIVARRIRVEGNGRAVVTWARPPVLPVPEVVGKAAPGAIGEQEGAPGRAGATGQPGNPGFPGRSAPTIYIFATQIDGVLAVDLRGQDGGSGGRGQAGGDGGAGRKGTSGVSSPFDCSRGGGNGGDGGNGGRGGQGGTGGRGGDGGTVIIAGPGASVLGLFDHLELALNGGKGGPGGPGGIPGAAGESGQGGNGSAFCGGGNAGRPGAPGPPAPPGATGPDGVAGIPTFTRLTDQQLAAVLGEGLAR
jgi:hypothetical protein